MPPSSRGRTSRSNGAIDLDEQQGDSASPERRHRGKMAADPLSRGIDLVLLRPLVFVLFVLVHILYAVGLVAVRGYRVLASLYAATRAVAVVGQPLEGEELALWKLRWHWRSAAAVVPKSVDSKATAAGAPAGTRNGIKDKLVGESRYLVKVPRHIAISIEVPPAMRTRSLVARYFLGLFLGRDLVVPENDPVNDEREEDARRNTFLKKTVQVAIRCAAVVGTREISVFDREGRLRAMARKAGQMGPDEIYIDNDDDVQDGCEGIRRGMKQEKIRIRFRWPDYDKPLSEATNGHVHTNGEMQGERMLLVNVLGPQDSKEALANVATILSQQDKVKKHVAPLTVKTVDETLQAHGYPTEPDLLILHGGLRRVRCLHGFPPWLIRLCEISSDDKANVYKPLTAKSFELAVQRFNLAEQRYGK